MEEIFELNSKALLAEIKKTLEGISYGSLEIFVQDGMVTQMTVRKIHKTKLMLQKTSERSTGSSSGNSRSVGGRA